MRSTLTYLPATAAALGALFYMAGCSDDVGVGSGRDGSAADSSATDGSAPDRSPTDGGRTQPVNPGGLGPAPVALGAGTDLAGKSLVVQPYGYGRAACGAVPSTYGRDSAGGRVDVPPL